MGFLECLHLSMDDLDFLGSIFSPKAKMGLFHGLFGLWITSTQDRGTWTVQSKEHAILGVWITGTQY